MFQLKDKNDLIGSNVMDLVDPAFVQALSADGIRSVFKLKPLDPSLQGQSVKLEVDNILTGVRTDGTTFNMRIEIIEETKDDITAILSDLYTDSLDETMTQLSSRANTESLLFMNSASSSFAGGYVVDINEREDAGWIDTGHFVDGLQELSQDKEAANATSLAISSDFPSPFPNARFHESASRARAGHHSAGCAVGLALRHSDAGAERAGAQVRHHLHAAQRHLPSLRGPLAARGGGEQGGL